MNEELTERPLRKQASAASLVQPARSAPVFAAKAPESLKEATSPASVPEEEAFKSVVPPVSPGDGNGRKLVHFRSIDPDYRLIWKGSWAERVNGQTIYHPSEGCQFENCDLLVEDNDANSSYLAILRHHPMNPLRFREVTSDPVAELTQTDLIALLDAMTDRQLQGIVTERGIVTRGDGRDSLILALMKANCRPHHI